MLGILTDVYIVAGNVDIIYIIRQNKGVIKEMAPQVLGTPRDPAYRKGCKL
jgi:hypothetical protein